jgi:hypothetical protein
MPPEIWKHGKRMLIKRWKRAFQAWNIQCLEPVLPIIWDFVFELSSFGF